MTERRTPPRAGRHGAGTPGEPRPIYLASADRRQRRRRRRRQRRRRWPLLAVCLIALAAVAWLAVQSDGRGTDPARTAATVRVELAGRTILERPVARLRKLGSDGLRAWLARVPAARRERRGRALISLQTDRRALGRAVRRAMAAGGATVTVPQRPIASRVRLPVVKQALRNNCETAALSMLLVARGIRAPQLRLQRQLPRSGPLDPRTAGDGTMVWGDPGRGFVGRPEGGGGAGGYGVYEGPIAALARRRGAELRDLSRRRASAIYRTILEGRPVMAWIGLSDGPYKTWRTPEGKSVTGNFGEHTVVLVGIRGDRLSVNDPLVGERTSWSREQFELMWARLGRRALGA